MSSNIAKSAVIHANVSLGVGVVIEDFCVIGKSPDGTTGAPTVIGAGALIRTQTVIYAGVTTGTNFTTGDKANIREGTRIGDDVSIGTMTVIEHSVVIGDGVRIHSRAFIPEYSTLEGGCWIGPGVVMTNAKYPQQAGTKATLQGPLVQSGAIVGANATLLPGLTIGRRSLIGAGAVVTKDTVEEGVYAGNPAKLVGTIRDLGYALES